MRAELAAVEELPGRVQMTTDLTFAREGNDKPVCVAESPASVYLGSRQVQASSNSPAAPMPPPTHIVTTTQRTPRRRPSSSA